MHCHVCWYDLFLSLSKWETPWYHEVMITAFFVFMLGACVGSFCSVLLHRLRFGGPIVAGRSQCVACKHPLGVIDLIPVLSWLIRRGRCHYCQSPFSWQYLALEITFGVLFLGAFYRYCCFADICPSWSCLMPVGRLVVFLVFLALVFVYDARHGEIPDVFSLTGVVTALVINIFILPASWFWFLAATAAGAGFFGVQYAVSRGKWIGDGDIMLGAMLGAMLGWPNVFSALILAYVMGLAVVLVLMLGRRKKLTDTIPLGPLLALATAIILFMPPNTLLNFWYALAL